MNREQLKTELREFSREEVEKLITEIENEVPPEPLDNINWKLIQDMVEELTTKVDCTGYGIKDFEQHLFEEVMMLVYGPKYFDWYNCMYQG